MRSTMLNARTRGCAPDPAPISRSSRPSALRIGERKADALHAGKDVAFVDQLGLQVVHAHRTAGVARGKRHFVEPVAVHVAGRDVDAAEKEGTVREP